MSNKLSQKEYYDSYEDFDAIELGVVDGRENEYRKRFIARRAEKMVKLADLDEESTILELGCGTGIYAIHWLKPSVKFYGLDISKGMLRIAAAKIKSESDKTLFLEGDAENLPFKDASFDAVLSVNTIEHLDDVPLTLKEMKRVCRDGGKIVLSVPNGNFSAQCGGKLISLLKRFLIRFLRVKNLTKPHRTYYLTHRDFTMGDFTQLFSEVGIRVEHKVFMGFVPHQIIPVRAARYFRFIEVLEKMSESIPWIRTRGGTIIICGEG